MAEVMANLPAARSTVVILFCLLGCLCPNLSAQILPFAPISPTDAKERQSFSRAVDAYAGRILRAARKVFGRKQTGPPGRDPRFLSVLKIPLPISP
jgi:hypothetical protein